MAQPKPDFSTVSFTVAQLQYLEHVFPDRVFYPNSSETEMRHYFGTRAVVEAVRSKTRGLNGRIETNTSKRGGGSPQDIPTPG
jgi:hypothetical protein